MRYGYLIKKPYFDLGFHTRDYNLTRYSPNQLDLVFRSLFVYDNIVDSDRQEGIQEVISEALETLKIEDQAFASAISTEYLVFLKANVYSGKWQKIKQDHNFLIKHEERRRNKENPYHNTTLLENESWERMPEVGKAYKNRSWQFEAIYKDINYLCLKLKTFLKDLEEKKVRDADIIRVRVNSILAADKIIYALDSIGNKGAYLEGSTNIIDIKLGLDGLKSAEIFLDRVIESLHKIKWFMEENDFVSEQTNSFISFASQISDEVRKKIKDNERRIIMFMSIEEDYF